MNDTDFIKAFQTGTIEPKAFNHEAHLRLAWIYLRNYAPEKAIVTFCDALLHYVRSKGAETKYHQTLSEAAMRIVNERMVKNKSRSFEDFLKENKDLQDDFKKLIRQHYSMACLHSENAKMHYIEPDLKPFNC